MRKSAELRKAEIVAAVLDLADRIGPWLGLMAPSTGSRR